MTLRDVTLDTNVLMHADNTNEKRHEDAKAFVLKMLNGDTAICVDLGFSPTEADN